MNDRFTSRHPFSRAELEAYTKGDLPPEQQHEVELLLEESPLHQEAVEGLRSMPASLSLLEKHRPRTGGGHGAWYLGGGLLIAVIGTVWFLGQREGEVAVQEHLSPPAEEVATSPAYGSDLAPIPPSEIQAAEELPESLQIGHEPLSERPPVQVVLPVDRSAPTERADPLKPSPSEVQTRKGAQEPKNAPRTSRQLVFLHDLKLVHPDELYPVELPVLYATGVPASRYSEQVGEEAIWDQPRREPTVPYLEFMDRSLEAFAKGDNANALADLKYVLSYLPNDVNCQFYAGLSAYNLGQTRRAQQFFRSAEANRIDTFAEEAEWYAALCEQKLNGWSAAQNHFQKIATTGGFYAEKARAKLHR